MNEKIIQCQSFDEVRQNIDRIDDEMIRLIAEREQYVMQASVFKKNTSEVKAPIVWRRLSQRYGRKQICTMQTLIWWKYCIGK